MPTNTPNADILKKKREAEGELENALEALAGQVAADETFAQELYTALCNMRWRKHDWDDQRAPLASMTWRGVGDLVATLEGRDGSYIDFYCSGNEGEVSERVRVALGDLGWTPVPWPD